MASTISLQEAISAGTSRGCQCTAWLWMYIDFFWLYEFSALKKESSHLCICMCLSGNKTDNKQILSIYSAYSYTVECTERLQSDGGISAWFTCSIKISSLLFLFHFYFSNCYKRLHSSFQTPVNVVKACFFFFFKSNI